MDTRTLQSFFTKVVICLSCGCVSLYADKNWIPIQPIPFDAPSKIERNLSKPPASVVENIKRLQRLMDKQNTLETTKQDTAKNWYLLDEPAGD